MGATSSHRSARLSYALALVGVALFIPAGVAAARLLHAPAASYVAGLAAVAWALVFAGRAWSRIDETAREAQKSAALWGSTGGVLIALLACATMPVLRETWHALFVWLDAHRGAWPLAALSFTAGALFVALMSSAGFLLSWIGWWAAKR